MKDARPVEWARRLIDDQLERLSELRNANPRDPGFKLWRQTTLTVIQRIWPGDLARCERFRRVPFSSTSPRPTRAQIRENYERGCAEASAYLKILTLELETQGLSKSAAVANPKPAQLPADLAGPPAQAPPDPRDMFEPSPLDRIKPPEATAPAPAPNPPAPAPPAPPVAPPPTPKAASPAAKPSAPPPPPPAQALPAKPRKGRQQLKEMLGFGEVSVRGSSPGGGEGSSSFDPPPPPPAFGAERKEDVLDPRLEAMLAEAEETAFSPGGTPPAQGVAPAPVAPEETFDSAEEAYTDFEVVEDVPADEAFAEDAPQDPDPATETTGRRINSPGPGDLGIDFLNRSRTSPAQPSAPTPVASPAKPAPAVAPAPAAASVAAAPRVAVSPPPATPPSAPAPVGVSPTSAALVAIASQVDRLDVPEGQRKAASEALIDLARQLDEGIASFDSIREILWIVADYPALARRTIPLLIPHLDLE